MVSKKEINFQITIGDVFAIPLGNGKYGYGQIVGGGQPKTYVIYDITADKHPDVNDIVSKKIIFFTHTVDVQIEDGVWHLIGKIEVPENIRFPEYIVDTPNGYFVTNFEGELLRPANPSEKELLKTRKSVSPSIIEDAIKAQYGIEEWYPYLENIKYN